MGVPLTDDGGSDTVADEPNNEAGPFDVRTIKFLAALMSRHDLSEIDLREGDTRIRLLRGGHHGSATAPLTHAPLPAASAQPPAAAPAADKPAKTLVEIKSEGIGIFFAAAKPGAEPFVRLGSRVQPDTVVGMIEAMKLYTELPAGCNGVIVEVLVTNEQSVEYGQVLFRVDPTA